MPFDDEAPDERPLASGPLPPDDRLWRHPSELAGGTAPPSSWMVPEPQPAPRRSTLIAALAGAGLAGALVAVGVMWVAGPTRVVQEASPTASLPVTTAAYSAAMPAATLARKLAPSLVHVTAAQGDGWVDGTGVWLDDQGAVAVASAIVDGSGDITVVDHRGHQTRAMAIGSDPATGMTVLRVADHDDLATGLAATQAATAGQPIAVIGANAPSSGGASQRVLTASVSATGIRTTVDPVVLHDAVQLDRSLPSDSLGGVAVDAKGAVVGFVLSQSGADDLAVLVPADEALAAARDLRDDGEVRRAWLGVRAVDLEPTVARLLAIDAGARLTQIDRGSPAAAAGLERSDVIVRVGDADIDGASDLVLALRQHHPGEEVAVVWHRGNEVASATITLGG